MNDTANYFSGKKEFIIDIKNALSDLRKSKSSELIYTNDNREIYYIQVNNQYMLLDFNDKDVSIYQDYNFIANRRPTAVFNIIESLNTNSAQEGFHDIPKILTYKSDFKELYTSKQIIDFQIFSSNNDSIKFSKNFKDNPLIEKYGKSVLSQNGLLKRWNYTEDILNNYTDCVFKTSTSVADIYDLFKNLSEINLISHEKFPLSFFKSAQESCAYLRDSDFSKLIDVLDLAEKSLKKTKEENFNNVFWKHDNSNFILIENEFIYVIKKEKKKYQEFSWDNFNVYARKNDTINNFLKDIKENNIHPLAESIIKVSDFTLVNAAEECIDRFSSATQEILCQMDQQRMVNNKERNLKLN